MNWMHLITPEMLKIAGEAVRASNPELIRMERGSAAEQARMKEEFDLKQQQRDESAAEQARMKEEFDLKQRQRDVEMEELRRVQERMRQDMELECARYKEEQTRLEREQAAERERLKREFQENLEEEKRTQAEQHSAAMEESGRKYEAREQLIQELRKEQERMKQDMEVERTRYEEEQRRLEQEQEAERERLKRQFQQNLEEEKRMQAEQHRAAMEQLGRLYEERGQLIQELREEQERMKQNLEVERARRKEPEEKRLEREQGAECERLKREFQENLEEQKRIQAEQHRAAMEELGWKYKEREQLLQAQNDLYKRGISPKVWPTDEQWARATRQLYPDPLREKFHCAVAGATASGKSSLINALRGIGNRDNSAAKVGAFVEITTDITVYPHPSPTPSQNQWVWYEVPRIETLNVPSPEYFNVQGLFVFDMIIMVVDNRFTSQDIAILQQCVLFKIPSFIVRSKSDQHINNIMYQELGYNSDEEDADAGTDRKSFLNMAKEELVKNTRARFEKKLRESELDHNQRIYMVSADCVRFAANSIDCELNGSTPPRAGKRAEYTIDEFDLIKDQHKAITERRHGKLESDPYLSEADTYDTCEFVH